MERETKVLICDDDSLYHLAIKQALKGKFDCRSAYNGDEALTILRKYPIDVLLLDVQMRTLDEGLRYLPRFRELDNDLAVVMISGMTDFQTVREAMRLGASDYIPKDFDPNDLAHTIGLVLDRRRLIQRQGQQNFEALNQQKHHVMVGKSPSVHSMRKVVEKFSASHASVVITGETGTGKEVVARQLRGTMPDGSLAPFVAVDSATIQSSTAESILFGHEKGAFTGAEKTTKGIFEEADGGIVYFDEIANMPLDIQSKLLRVLQEKEVSRLGSSRVMQLNFRVVCATNRDLEEMARRGEFKDDLLQRLNVLPVLVPPLRERKEDIPDLVRHFLSKQPGDLKFTEDALEALQGYEWPGNIRELQNVVAYAAAMVEGTEVDVADLPPRIRDSGTSRARLAVSESEGSFYDQVGHFEKAILAREYANSDGNVSKLALTLGMDRSHLYTKLKEHGIHIKR